MSAEKQHRLKRAGTMYLAVMGVTIIVGTVALASAAVSRLHVRGALLEGQLQEAQLLAKAGVEYGSNYISVTPGWRTAISSSVQLPQFAMGSGTMSWTAIDADGSFTNDPADFITVRGIGRVGDTIAVEEVLMEPSGGPLTSLNAALHVDGYWDADVRIVTTDGQVSANGAIDVLGSAQINGNAWATGEVWNVSNVTGTITDFQPTERQMPSVNALEYYKARGTWIDIEDVTQNLGTRNFTNRVLSPASNPFGDTNPEGIYVIDCEGQRLEIYHSRFLATLVILNPGSGSRVYQQNHLAPAVKNYPVLLVDGSFAFDLEGALNDQFLRESTTLANFNPPGTPYEGEEDSSNDDDYPSEIHGLVYVSGTLTTTDNVYFKGAVICNALSLGENATFNYDVTLYDYPPPGFRTGNPMRIVPGTWRRAAY